MYIQGIAVTGSVSDAFDTVPWIVRLRKELAAASQRKQRLLGICFGCQALAIALGGVAGELLLPSMRYECNAMPAGARDALLILHRTALALPGMMSCCDDSGPEQASMGVPCLWCPCAGNAARSQMVHAVHCSSEKLPTTWECLQMLPAACCSQERAQVGRLGDQQSERCRPLCAAAAASDAQRGRGS